MEKEIVYEDLDKIQAECYAELAKYEKKVWASNRRLMRVIKHMKSPSFYRNLNKYLKELKEGCYHTEWMLYEIVRKTIGKWQKERLGREIKGVWVDQWATGDSGDSWSGYVYIQIKEGRFLRVHFEM